MPSNAQVQSLTLIRQTLTKLNSAPPQIQNAAKAVDTQLTQASNNSSHLTASDAKAFEGALQDVVAVLPGITAGVLLAVEGFEDGDAISGVAGLMDTCAQLSVLVGIVIGTSIGAMAGGVGAGPGAGVGAFIGACVGSVFTMISNVLTFFAPKTESLAQELKKALEDQKAQDQIDKIHSVHRAFLTYAQSLNKSCDDIETGIHSANFNPNVQQKIVAEINFVEGNGVVNYWEVVNWLATHQTHRQWPLILDGVCSAYSIVLIAVVRLVSIMNSYESFEAYRKADENKKKHFEDLADTASAKLVTFGEATKINLDDLKRLRPAARNWGTLWSVAHDDTVHMGLTDPNAQHKGMSAYATRISTAVCSKDQTKPNPAYHVYHVGGGNKLYYWRVAFNNQDFSREEARSLDKVLTDVFATTGTSTDSNNAIVWELSNKTRIEAFLRDENGKEISKIFSADMGAEGGKGRLEYIRAVHDPYSYSDDPSFGSLADVGYIVYGLQEDGRIFVFGQGKSGNIGPSSLTPPVSKPKGIGVDQDYVWVFAEKEFACATHASVMRAVRARQDDSAWSKSTAIPGSGSNKVLECLCPSDDGTLVASDPDRKVYSATYSVDRTKNTLSLDPWTQLNGYAEKSLEKLPVYCWPQFESLLETLETFADTKLRLHNTARA